MPTLTGFLAWVRAVMGLTTSQLPDNSPAIPWAFNVAVAIVSLDLNASPVGTSGDTIYELAVYNLAGSNLLNWAPNNPPNTFFTDYRAANNLNAFVSGVIQSASDEGTSDSFVVSDFMKNFTLADLQYLKDPYGRQYLAFAQRLGTLWGLT